MANIVIATEKDFEEIIKSVDTVLVDFYATWCAPCRAMSPFVEQLAREYSDVIDVIKIDIEKNEAFAAAANIHSIPTLFFVDRNGNITRHTGSLPYPELERMTKTIIA